MLKCSLILSNTLSIFKSMFKCSTEVIIFKPGWGTSGFLRTSGLESWDGICVWDRLRWGDCIIHFNLGCLGVSMLRRGLWYNWRFSFILSLMRLISGAAWYW